MDFCWCDRSREHGPLSHRVKTSIPFNLSGSNGLVSNLATSVPTDEREIGANLSVSVRIIRNVPIKHVLRSQIYVKHE